jgi:hypothetical protein
MSCLIGLLLHVSISIFFLFIGISRGSDCFTLYGLERVLLSDAPPSSLCDPKRVQRVGFVKLVRNLVPFLVSSTKRGRGVVLEAPGLD